jgi:phosphopantothenoylcysteine decarboxylase/phosphopantothenate--cysteine ligase
VPAISYYKHLDMSHLQDKKIILAITGSIAAYKAAVLVRLLVKAGAEVQVLMTEAATRFITPLTLSTLSKRPVYSTIHDGHAWNDHVTLGLWADAFVLAPLTATSLARLSMGLADNIVTAVYLSARCPVFFAPAMDVDMWHHPATQEHVQRLQGIGHHLIPVGHGELASGLVGDGRMAEPEEIIAYLERHLSSGHLPLSGNRLLVTAGPTYEPIDPVRFIGNRSSGMMGIAIAEAAAARGARVALVLGPSRLEPSHPGIEVYRVETAKQMHEQALDLFAEVDVAILAAAVSDYRPARIAEEKIKKTAETLHLDLVKNPDIAADLAKVKTGHQLIIGFALETHDELSHAREKMVRKKFDCIVLNSLNDKGAGFHVPTNKITMLFADNKVLEFELKKKSAVAEDIIDALERMKAQQQENEKKKA